MARKQQMDVYDWLGGIGVATLLYGLWLIYHPLAWVVAGLLLLGASVAPLRKGKG